MNPSDTEYNPNRSKHAASLILQGGACLFHFQLPEIMKKKQYQPINKAASFKRLHNYCIVQLIGF